MVALNLTPKSLTHCFLFYTNPLCASIVLPKSLDSREKELRACGCGKLKFHTQPGPDTHFTKRFLHKPKKRWHAPPKEFNFSLPPKAKKLDYLLHKTLCANGQNLLTKKLRGLRSYLNCTNELLQANCLKSNVHRISGHHKSLC